MFDRLALLIGKNKLNLIKYKKILVLGLGGVGGYVVETLIRSGISDIILVDFDKIDITNLNRQIISNLNNLENLKTDEWEKRILSINKDVKITKINCFIDEDNYKDLFNLDIDYFIDCCDTINTKKLIIEECLYKKIKFISSMGMGNKFDANKIEITDIRNTKNDKIAKILRKWVKDNNINDKILVCSSTEVPKDIKGTVIGSTAFVPSTAGLIIASHIINDIIK